MKFEEIECGKLYKIKDNDGFWSVFIVIEKFEDVSKYKCFVINNSKNFSGVRRYSFIFRFEQKIWSEIRKK